MMLWGDHQNVKSLARQPTVSYWELQVAGNKDRNVVKLDTSVDNGDVIKLLKLEAVSFYVRLLLNCVSIYLPNHNFQHAFP